MITQDDPFYDALHDPCPHPDGTRIQITGRMPEEADPLPIGATGTVTGGNGSQLHVQWDNGRALTVLVNHDPYRVLDESNDEPRR